MSTASLKGRKDTLHRSGVEQMDASVNRSRLDSINTPARDVGNAQLMKPVDTRGTLYSMK